MKKYKINGKIVCAKDEFDAIKKLKDRIDYRIKNRIGQYLWENGSWKEDYTFAKLFRTKEEAEKYIRENNLKYVDIEIDDSIKTKDTVDYEYLLSEERKAVQDYKRAISETNDKNELYVFSHILKEEAHHIELLENLQKGKVEFNDSVKDEDKYVVYADGTWNNYRALFRKKIGAAKYSTESDADKFTEEEAERLAKPSSNYNWIKKRV